jgi:hypothetical protein
MEKMTDAWQELVPPPVKSPHTPENVFALVKFGAREHMESLHGTGQLYMRTLASFLSIEDKALRGDPTEGLAAFFQPGRIQLQIGDHVVAPGDIVGPVHMSYQMTRALHVYSMFALTEREVASVLKGGQAIDPRCLEFGDTALVVTNVSEFFRRVSRAAEEAGVSHARSLIHYLDRRTHHGQFSPFNKMQEYSWQSEYRIVVAPSENEIFYLELGSLEDISILTKAQELNGELKVTSLR